MLLVPVAVSRSDGGHCWLAELPADLPPGEDLDHARRSPLKLFEDGREIGPASAVIDEIRAHGAGRFCHWGRHLYFSASDNSNPNSNGRAYRVLIPASEEEARRELKAATASVAADAEPLQSCLSASFSRQGAEFHTAYTLRTLLSALGNAHFEIDGKVILEIGASPSNGLGIALGLLGARRVFLNNVLPLTDETPLAFATNVAAITGLMRPLKRPLSEVCVPGGSEGRVRLNPRLFETIPSTDAASLPGLDDAIDLVFSFSVLEHIRHLPAVLSRLRQVIARDGLAIHGIDLRDHTDFNHPLKYLQFTETEFQARYSDEHNRWRRADYIRMFEDSGWKVVRQRFAGQLPVLANGETDMLAVALEGPERMFVSDPATLGGAPRNHGLNPEYRDLSAEELKVLVLEVTAEPA